MRIDTHTHIMPEFLPDFNQKFGYGGFITLEHHKPCCAKMIKDGEVFREIEHNCWDAGRRVEECDTHNINVQVLSTIPVLFYYWAKDQHALEISKFLNNHIAEVVDLFPKRFVGLGTVPLQNIDLAIKEMERCKVELGMSGLEIGTHINGKNLGDADFFPFYQAAEDLGMSIFVHPWDMLGKDRMKKYWLPWLVGMPAETSLAICSMIFSGVFEKYPKLKILFAHAGGSFPSSLGRIEHGFNVRPDLVAVDNPENPTKYLRNLYLDSLTHDPDMLYYIIKLFGSDRIALGTDYPFPLGELQPGKLIETSQLPQADKDNLFYKTALDWLNLDIKRFL